MEIYEIFFAILATFAVVFLWSISNALDKIAFQLRRVAHAMEKKRESVDPTTSAK